MKAPTRRRLTKQLRDLEQKSLHYEKEAGYPTACDYVKRWYGNQHEWTSLSARGLSNLIRNYSQSTPSTTRRST